MKGARGYAEYFNTGQYGRLYIVSGSHARGKTFRIQVLPEGEVAKGNGENNLCLNKDAVLVYGVIGDQPGWTEYYGWLYKGKWIQDFEKELEKKKRMREEIAADIKNKIKEKEIERKLREKKLLEDYK